MMCPTEKVKKKETGPGKNFTESEDIQKNTTKRGRKRRWINPTIARSLLLPLDPNKGNTKEKDHHEYRIIGNRKV